MQVTPLRRVMPVSSTQQNITVKSRWSSISSPISDSDRPFLPKLVNYDLFEKKSLQQLLYECAQERVDAELKWKIFSAEIEKCIGRKGYSKHLVETLDDAKQWTALHYAVFNNNIFVCNKLTDKKSSDKHFLCHVNIVTGSGENILHIAARSSFLWTSSLSSTDSIVDPKQRDEEDVLVPKIIATLIDRGADVYHADDEGRTPLHLAVMNNCLPFVKYLLSKNANLYTITKLNANVLHLTFIPIGQKKQELSDMFEYILSKLKSSKSTSNFPWINERKNLAQMRTLDNRTPLVLAVCHPQTTEKIVQDLLDENSTVNILIDQSFSKLTIYQIQKLIAIEQVAKATRGRSSSFDHLRPLLYVWDPKICNQFFHFPCRYNNVGLLKWLIDSSSESNGSAKLGTSTNKNLNLNEPDHAGYTPLLTAVFYKSIKCVQYLLQNADTSAQATTNMLSASVNIRATNTNGENILHICAKHSISKELSDIVWKLAVQFDLPKEKDIHGNLPLHVAADYNQEDICEKLLTFFKATPDLLCAKNIQGQTAAHVATKAERYRIGPDRHRFDKDEKKKNQNEEPDKVKNDNEDFGLPILKLLWNSFPKDSRDKNLLFERDNDRQTCLHLAAAKGQQKTVEFLVEKVGLDIDAIADRRLTPLHLACQYGQEETVAYLIEHGASPTFRNAQSYNSLEIAIVNQHEGIVKELLTLPNWRELMSNAQRIHNSKGYDTPMRKLIRYMPNVAVWMIEENLTRTVGGQGKRLFKKVYDYEFYMDINRVKQWYTQGVKLSDEEEPFTERFHRRGCAAVCCCQENLNEENIDYAPYTNDAYTLVRNHPLIIASEQSQCSNLVEHPYNTFLRDKLFEQNGFYIIRAISFLFYATFLAIWTAIILMGKHPQYFFNKVGRNMTLDLDSCAIVSRILTAANDSEALKTTVYIRLKYVLDAILIFFVVQNIILIAALFPRVFRTIDYILEISAFVFTFIYIYDWNDWQAPVVFRCPVQYQIGAMGLLLSWLSMLTYVKRTTWFNIGVFVAMIQLIAFKFIRFIPVLLVVVCGFGFTHWMLLQNQDPFQSPVEAVIRTSLLMFELNYEEHLYDKEHYYQIIFVITIISAVVFCIFILNLLISIAVGEMPSLTIQGQIWQSQMLYDLLSDYSIISFQIIRLINCLSGGYIHRQFLHKHLHPIVVLEHDLKDKWFQKVKKYVKQHFFDEKIQADIIPIKTSQDTSKEDN